MMMLRTPYLLGPYRRRTRPWTSMVNFRLALAATFLFSLLGATLVTFLNLR
jgi:hypothetical protein